MGAILSRTDNEDEATSRKPNASNFHQQKLRAWQPILTASTILPVFFAIGIIFIPIGIALLATSSKIEEKVLRYDNDAECMKCEDGLLGNFTHGRKTNCTCSMIFNLTSLWEGDVFFYYGLSNFYQNHRRYVRSYDMKQLNGDLSSSVTADCDPFSANKNGTPIAPCGAVANSLFTDTFTITRLDTNEQIPLSGENIAWKSDREVKYNNPPGNLKEAFKKFAKPEYWTKPVYELNKDNPNTNGNGFENEDFIVWMRVAAFPTFRKLYRRLNRTAAEYKDGLPKGDYELNIEYNYPVKSFEGEKRFILTTTSWMGGKNPFLGIAYIVVGCLCLIFGFVFLVIHLKVRNGQAVINEGGH